MRAAIVCALVAVGVSAASCSQSEGPSAPPTPTDSLTTVTSLPPDDSSPTTSEATSSSATASTTTAIGAPPEMPAEAREPTEAGAEAFIRYYFDLFNYGAMTSSDGWLEEVSDSQCDLCSALSENLTSLSERGAHVAEQPVLVKGVQVDVTNETATGAVSFTQTVPAQLDADGNILEPAGKKADVEFSVKLRLEDEQWVLSDF